MRNTPFFSIIIPIYNVSNYLEQCLSSVLNQTFSDMEIICVNDGSTDGSREILRRFQGSDNRIVIIDTKNGGPSTARNLGFSLARGEYVFFIDSDDYADTELCAFVYERCKEHDPDIMVYGAYPFPEGASLWLTRNLTIRSCLYERRGIEALIYENGSTPYVWRDVFKRKFLQEHQIRFRPDVSFGEDLIFQFMAFPFAERILFSERRLYHYRWKRQGSAMFYAEKNLSQKYAHHIRSVNILAEYWKLHGLFEDYGTDFFKWTVSFLGPDLYRYTNPDKQELLYDVRMFWETYQLGRYLSELTDQQAFYFSYIMKEGS